MKNIDKLIQTMEEMQDKQRFTMRWFVWPDAMRLQDAQEYDGIVMPKEARNWCGTPACLLGHYGARKDLQDIISVRNGHLVYREPKTYENFDGDPETYDEDVYFCDDRILQHFDISPLESRLLFSEDGCGFAQTPADVIAYLKGVQQAQEAK